MVLHHVLSAAVVAGGGYVSLFKIIVAMLVLLVWARLMTWADADAVVAHLPRNNINVANLSGMVVAYAAFFLLPSFWIGFPLLLVIAGAEAMIYIKMREKVVGLRDLRRQWDDWLGGIRGKKKDETAAGQIILIGKGGTVPVPAGDAPDRAAYDAAQEALTEPLKKGSEQVDIDGRQESGTAIKYIVDGVAYGGRTLDRTTGAAAISYIKDIAGMDVADRRKPQTGTMKITLNGQKHDLKIQTAGSTAGEYMRLVIDPKNRHKFQLPDLGFSEAQLAKIQESIKENKGVVVLSTPKGMGLTSLMYGVLSGHDAFIQHLQTVERDPDEDLEGITQNKLPGNASPADEHKMVDWVISQQPDGILINKIEDPRSAVDLINYSKDAKRVYVAFRAASTFEALNQWRKLVGDDTLAVESLEMVINGRVLRKLCNNCKVPVAPDPATLRKLGMNPEKVTQLYQARTQPQRDQKGNPIPCTFCHDLRFIGRTGVFEIMTMTDELRQAVIGGKPVEPVFRKQRSKFLQEEALALVESGDTSVQEVKRVLKPDAAAAAATPAAPEAPPPDAAAAPVAKTPRRPAPGAVRKS
ncbi:MAG TPA: ATPase, T2SS/T4P/T4SS family [Tepidisphaeraceae bacterium]|nr:ATPase, T2SS/T4P/T4SS family [Tepidisphaeraceae bacterium]